ncbi:MAG: M6 family metalloprotease domain-containing protein [Promethearchaeota archaeon]
MQDKHKIFMVALIASIAFSWPILLSSLEPQNQVSYKLHSYSTITRPTTTPRYYGSLYMHSSSYTGNKSLVVILLEFNDKSPDSSHTQSYYNNLLFNESNPGSLTSYFKENSYGRLNISGIVTPWVKSSHDLSYYGEDSGDFPNIDDANTDIFEMAREAVQLADPYVDFSKYDDDGDGFVDNLIIIHAGEGQEASHDSDDIWSHRWNIQPWEPVDGKKASSYATLSESSPVGVFAHEYGHILSLPDLYDYTYSGAVFAGDWAVMDSGSWNGGTAGNNPAHFLGWSKMQLGFIPVSEREQIGINEEKTIEIIPTNTQTIPTGKTRLGVVNISSGIYYTVEVREKSGYFENYLPDQGVIITFCNDSARDEIFYGRPGAAVVKNAQPSYPDKSHAPYDIGTGENSMFYDEDRNIRIEVLSRDNVTGAYKVRISYLQLSVDWLYVNGSDQWQVLNNSNYNLTVMLNNSGTTTLESVVAKLETPASGVTITQNTVNYGDITPGVETNGTGNFSLQLASVSNTPINFTLNVTYTGGTSNVSFQLPVQIETIPPDLTILSPINASKYNASEEISIIGNASDPSGIQSGLFKAWVRTISSTSTKSNWKEMVIGNSSISSTIKIKEIGNFTIVVRLMDKSGNINESILSIQIIDKIAPSILLSVNGPRGNPARFAILDTELTIVTVVLDNSKVDDVNLSINAGPYFSIKNNTTIVEVTGGGSGDSGIARGNYTGYYFKWTPAVEGNQLISIKASDESGNISLESWEITILSQQTVIYAVVIISIIVIIFSIIIYSIKRAKKRKKVVNIVTF